MYLAALLSSINVICKHIIFLCAGLFFVDTYACEQPTIVAPSQHDDVVSARPIVSWLPVNSAVDYEVTIQSHVPEGEVVTQFTTTTADTKFVSQAALSRDRSIVSVRVKARCSASATSLETERIFFVDVRSLCPPVSQVVRLPMGQFTKVSWERNPQFNSVEVRTFGTTTMGQLEQVPQTQSFAVIAESPDKAGIIGVRGICKDANGPWTWISPFKS